MAGVVVELTGDEAKLLASMQKVIAQNAKTGDSFKGTGAKAKEAADVAVKEQQRVERENKKAADAIYAEHKKMLDNKAGESRRAGLAEEALARKTAFAEVNAAIKAADQEINAAEKILKAKQKLADEEAKVTDGPLAKLQSTVTVAAAITAAVGVATQAWTLYKKAQDDALATASGLSDSTRRLTQVAKSPADLAAMQQKADDASLQSGVGRDVARNVLFASRSEGFESAYQGIMAASQVVSPESASIVAGKLPALFGGKINALEAVSLALKGAEQSNLSFEQLASSLPTAAEGGALVGASPAELVATQSVLASRFKSGETASDRVKSFGSSAGIDPRFKGKGIVGAYKAIRDLPEDERTEYLGKNQELNTVYQILGEELEKIEKQILVMNEERKQFALGGGMLRSQMKIAQSDQTVVAVASVNKAKRLEEITREENLVSTAAVDFQAKAQANALIEKKGAGLVDRLVTTAVSSTLDYAPGTSSDTRAKISSGVGDRAYDMAQVAINPLGTILNPFKAIKAVRSAVGDFSGTNTTAVASSSIAARQNRAQADADASLDGSGRAAQPSQAETVNALNSQNDTMLEQSRLLKAIAENTKPNGPPSNTPDASAIRAMVSKGRE